MLRILALVGDRVLRLFGQNPTQLNEFVADLATIAVGLMTTALIVLPLRLLSNHRILGLHVGSSLARRIFFCLNPIKLYRSLSLFFEALIRSDSASSSLGDQFVHLGDESKSLTESGVRKLSAYSLCEALNHLARDQKIRSQRLIRSLSTRCTRVIDWISSRLAYVERFIQRHLQRVATRREYLRQEIQARQAAAASRKRREEMLLAQRQNQAAYAAGIEKYRGASQGESLRTRMPQDADDFESVCAEFSRRIGYTDAVRTPKGPDGGVDVFAKGMVGQCKFHSSAKIRGEDIRALAGSRLERKANDALFFAYGPGYTDDAISAAKATGVQLYLLDAHTQSMKRIA